MYIFTLDDIEARKMFLAALQMLVRVFFHMDEKCGLSRCRQHTTNQINVALCEKT